MIRRKTLTPCLLLLQLTVGACSADEIQNPRFQQLSEGIGRLSINILKKFANDRENALLSAYGISSALAVCMFGSEGETYASLHDALGLNSISEADTAKAFRDAHRVVSTTGIKSDATKNNLTLSSANAVFVNESLELRPEFVETLQRVYPDAVSESVDFANDADGTQRKINSFINEATHGKIPDLLSQPLDTQTLLAVTNAVYFHGAWKTAFEIKQSDEAFNNFTCPGSSNKPLMKPQWMKLNTKLRYGRSSDLKAHFVELPYQSVDGTAVSMVLMLPFENSTCDFTGWVNSSLEWNKMTEIMEELSETRVHLTLPKFQLKSTFDLKETLSSLGFDIAFSPHANFGRMHNGNVQASINNFLHKAKMSVDELGTEAAAASGAFLRRRSRPLPSAPPIEIVFNRSFLAMIIVNLNESRLPLFTATVNAV